MIRARTIQHKILTSFVRDILREGRMNEADDLSPEDFEKQNPDESSRGQFKSSQQKLKIYDQEFSQQISLGLPPAQADMFASMATMQMFGGPSDLTGAVQIPPLYDSSEKVEREWISTALDTGFEVYDNKGSIVALIKKDQVLYPSDIKSRELYNKQAELIATKNKSGDRWITAKAAGEDKNTEDLSGSKKEIIQSTSSEASRISIKSDELVSNRWAIQGKTRHPQFVVYARLPSGTYVCRKLEGKSPDAMSISEIISSLSAQPVPSYRQSEILRYLSTWKPAEKGTPSGVAADILEKNFKGVFLMPASSISNLSDPIGHSSVDALIDAKSGQECVYSGPESALFDLRVLKNTKDQVLESHIKRRMAICATYQPLWFGFFSAAMSAAISAAVVPAAARLGALITVEGGPLASLAGAVTAALGSEIVIMSTVDVLVEAVPYAFAYSYFKSRGEEINANNTLVYGSVAIVLSLFVPRLTSKIGSKLLDIKNAGTSPARFAGWMVENSDNWKGKLFINLTILVFAGITSCLVSESLIEENEASNFRFDEVEKMKAELEQVDKDQADIDLRNSISKDNEAPDLGLVYQFGDLFAF